MLEQYQFPSVPIPCFPLLVINQHHYVMSYYISPHFLDKLAVHITKNFLNIPGLRVPLMLGIHGRKGEGKSFQCELVYQRMGIETIHMSGGELESPDAGDPARLIRLRYREAGELSRVRGRMVALMINDLDAGAGRIDQYTQYTVNTQLVNATLMNIADNPTNVQLPGSYDEQPTQRIPIIVTGNDFATLYAPLIRDGRMEKFFWEPSREDRVGIVNGIFAADDIPRADVEKLVDLFSEQAIDFYSALRSRLYDEQIRQLIQEVGIENIAKRVVNSVNPPQFRRPNFALPNLIEMGEHMVREQQRIRELRLMQEYNEPLQRDIVQRSTIQSTRQQQVSHPEAIAASPNRRETGRNRSYAHDSSPSQPSPNGQSPLPSPDQTSNHNTPAVTALRELMAQSQRVGIEYVDDRRFRMNSWQCYATTAANEAEAIATLQACLDEHPNDYIRLVGIGGDRRRLSETIVQRPK